MTAGIDAQAFTEFEQRGWQQAVGPYEKYFVPLTAQAGDVLLAAVAPQPRGCALLDLASGPGHVARRAAAAGCAPVLGIDFSAQMVQLARELAPAVEFRQGDVQQLDLPDASFDAVTMNFGMLHLAQPERALAEAFRVLRPGGRFGFTVWAGPAKSLGFAVILDAIARHADPALGVPAGPPFFLYGEREVSLRALREAGFAEAEFRELAMSWRFAAAEDYYTVMLEGTARTGGLLRLQTPATLQAIRADVLRGCERFRQADGSLAIPMYSVLALGRKPARG